MITKREDLSAIPRECVDLLKVLELHVNLDTILYKTQLKLEIRNNFAFRLTPLLQLKIVSLEMLLSYTMRATHRSLEIVVPSLYM